MSKAFDADGNEIEIYTADEHTAAITAEVEKTKKEVEGIYTPKLSALETELGGAKKALDDRAGEFKQFRKLNEETINKLSIAEKTIYDNQLHQEEERVARETEAKTRLENSIDASIRATSGADEKLFTKMKDMWKVIGVNAVTPEEIETKKKMVLGAISQTEPNLVASVAGFSGGYKPPVTEKKEGESFADTDQGKGLASLIGLKLEADKK